MTVPARPSARCRALLLELSRYLDGDLTPARRRRVERHIKACACCGTMAARLRKTMAVCRAEGKRRPPSDVMSRAVERIRVLMATLAITAGLFLAPASAQQAPPKAPEHSMPMPPSGGMMNHAKMMSDMKAADARLEALVQTMKSTSGNDKVRAMQELMTELVQNQVDMHRRMAMMHEHMMSQMPHK